MKSWIYISAVSNMLPGHQMALFLTDWAFYVAIIISFSSFQPSGDEKHHRLLFKSLRPSSSSGSCALIISLCILPSHQPTPMKVPVALVKLLGRKQVEG